MPDHETRPRDLLGLIVVVGPFAADDGPRGLVAAGPEARRGDDGAAGLRGDRLRPAGGGRRPRRRCWSLGTRHVAIDLGDWVVDPAALPLLGQVRLRPALGAVRDPVVRRSRGRSAPSPASTCTASAGFNRFFVLYAIFVLGMVVTSLAGTIETLFAGWELVGLSSALLVAFFQERPAPARNGLWVWIVYRVSDAALLLAAVVMHHLQRRGRLRQAPGRGALARGARVGCLADQALAGRAAAAGGRGGQVGPGAVLGLAAAGDGRADALERRLLRRPVGPPRGVPAAAGQPAPGAVGLALRGGRRAGADDGRVRLPGRQRADRHQVGAVVRLALAGRDHRRRDRPRASATSRWSTCSATPACGRSSSSGRRPCCTTTTRWRTPSASTCRRPGAPWDRLAPRRCRAWLYRLALERGYLDALPGRLRRRPVRPGVPLVRRAGAALDRLPRRARRRASRTRSSPTSERSKSSHESCSTCPGSSSRSRSRWSARRASAGSATPTAPTAGAWRSPGTSFACAVLAWLAFYLGIAARADPALERRSRASSAGRSSRSTSSSAPLVPAVALLHFLTALATARTHMRRFSFSWSLAAEVDPAGDVQLQGAVGPDRPARRLDGPAVRRAA